MAFYGFFSRKRIAFILLFAVLSFAAYHVNVAQIIGAENQFFTLFQFIGPLPGAFLGPFVGIAAVFLAQLANYLVLGKAFDMLNVARLLPMLFAVYYFGTKNSEWKRVGAPIAAIIAFWTHPVGAQAWFYALYWVIPIIAMFSDRLLIKSLGTTFTAHAVGSVVFLYTIPTTPELWLALIPIVMMERLLFASGITVSYIGFNTMLNKIESAFKTGVLHTDQRYVLSRKMFRLHA